MLLSCLDRSTTFLVSVFAVSALPLIVTGCGESDDGHDHGSAASGGASGGTGATSSGGGMHMDGGNMSMGCVGQGDSYSAGMSKDGARGNFSLVLVESDPTVMGAGRYTWTVKLLDSSGDAVPDATLSVEPWMVAMNHGAEPNAIVSDEGGGIYTLDPVNLFMAGLWEVRVDIAAGGTSDEVVYAFCLSGSGMEMDSGTHMHDGGMSTDGGI